MSGSYESPYPGSPERQGSDEPIWERIKRAGRRLDARLNRFLRPGTLDWAAACHLAPLVAVAIPIPGLGALLALAIWHTKRDVEPGVGTQGREALNFQLNVAFWMAMGLALPVIPALLVQIVASAIALIAGLATLRGEDFRYPYILRPVH